LHANNECMIHPDTYVRIVNPEIGYGVFASRPIPKGTIVYVKDELELEITPGEFAQYSKELQFHIEKYSYIDERGKRIISWDIGKYVNHCCYPNTMSTGYGFEIATRDIEQGEEITDEYGLFNLEYNMDVRCGKPQCRLQIQPDDILHYYTRWDKEVKSSLDHLQSVDQPLWSFLSEEVIAGLEQYYTDHQQYRSVLHLKNQLLHLNGRK
jgi:hypothetical protein